MPSPFNQRDLSKWQDVQPVLAASHPYSDSNQAATPQQAQVVQTQTPQLVTQPVAQLPTQFGVPIDLNGNRAEVKATTWGYGNRLMPNARTGVVG